MPVPCRVSVRSAGHRQGAGRPACPACAMMPGATRSALLAVSAARTAAAWPRCATLPDEADLPARLAGFTRLVFVERSAACGDLSDDCDRRSRAGAAPLVPERTRHDAIRLAERCLRHRCGAARDSRARSRSKLVFIAHRHRPIRAGTVRSPWARRLDLVERHVARDGRRLDRMLVGAVTRVDSAMRRCGHAATGSTLPARRARIVEAASIAWTVHDALTRLVGRAAATRRARCARPRLRARDGARRGGGAGRASRWRRQPHARSRRCASITSRRTPRASRCCAPSRATAAHDRLPSRVTMWQPARGARSAPVAQGAARRRGGRDRSASPARDPHRRGAREPRRDHRCAGREHPVLPAVARPRPGDGPQPAGMGVPRRRDLAASRSRNCARQQERAVWRGCGNAVAQEVLQ